MNEFELLKFNEHTIRIVRVSGEPWFVLKDAALAVGYKDIGRLRERTPGCAGGEPGEIPTLLIEVQTRGGKQPLRIVRFPALYEIFSFSRKPEADKFLSWASRVKGGAKGGAKGGDAQPTLKTPVNVPFIEEATKPASPHTNKGQTPDTKPERSQLILSTTRQHGGSKRGEAHRNTQDTDKNNKFQEVKQVVGEDTEGIERGVTPMACPKSSANRATLIKKNFSPDQHVYNAIKVKYPHLDLEHETEKFRDYWVSVPTAKARKRDWNATWRNWMRNANDYQAVQARQPASKKIDRIQTLIEAGRMLDRQAQKELK